MLLPRRSQPGLLGSNRLKDQRPGKRLLERAGSRRGMPELPRRSNLETLPQGNSVATSHLDVTPLSISVNEQFIETILRMEQCSGLGKLFEVIHLWHDLTKQEPEGRRQPRSAVSHIVSPLKPSTHVKAVPKHVSIVSSRIFKMPKKNAAPELSAESKGKGTGLTSPSHDNVSMPGIWAPTPQVRSCKVLADVTKELKESWLATPTNSLCAGLVTSTPSSEHCDSDNCRILSKHGTVAWPYKYENLSSDASDKQSNTTTIKSIERKYAPNITNIQSP